MIVIFIAGASASGKSTISNQLKEHLEYLSHTCEILRMDDYFKEAPAGCDLDHYISTTDFTKLEMRDLELLANQIIELNNNIDILKTEYCFKTCKRSQTKQLHTPEFLIVEGTFVLHFANIMGEFKSKFTELFKLSIFIRQSDYNETLTRRILRDGSERGQSEEVVRRKDQLFLRPAFLNIMEPSGQTANLQVINDRREDLDDSINAIMEYLENNFELQDRCKFVA